MYGMFYKNRMKWCGKLEKKQQHSSLEMGDKYGRLNALPNLH